MKTWINYFESKEEPNIEVVNEDHKEGKEEQAKWICEIVNKMSAEEVAKVYKFIEDKLNK